MADFGESRLFGALRFLSASACKPPFAVRMRLSVQTPWRMIRRPLLYVRSSSDSRRELENLIDRFPSDCS